MTEVKIYQPARSTMQSGSGGRASRWVLEYLPQTPTAQDPLMGWTSSTDMNRQIKLFFTSQQDAIAYAERKGLSYRVVAPAPRVLQKKTYSENFF